MMLLMLVGDVFNVYEATFAVVDLCLISYSVTSHVIFLHMVY